MNVARWLAITVPGVALWLLVWRRWLDTGPRADLILAVGLIAVVAALSLAVVRRAR